MGNKVAELFKYGIIGIFTTLINYIVFAVSLNYLKVSWVIANIIAWIASVLFAFWGNRNVVFKSKNSIVKEMTSFFILRIVTLGIEYICLYLLIDIIKCDEYLAKILVNVIVIISNYILCKFSIFNKKETKNNQ